MNRNILAVIIPALLAASAANSAEIYNKNTNKLDLYGKIDGLHYFSKNKDKDNDQSYAILGFKGETQITDQLTGYGQLEYDAKINNTKSQDTSNNMRLGFAGLKFADYGSFDYGRNYGILHDVSRWTNTLAECGGRTYTFADNFMTSVTNGVATYRNKNLFGLVEGINLALQYQGKNNEAGRFIKRSNGEGWGLSSTYDIGDGVSIAAAYTSSHRADNQKRDLSDLGKKAEAWTFGSKYDANNVYLAATYAETHNMTPFGGDIVSTSCSAHSGECGGFARKTHNLEVTAQYQFDFGLRPAVSYLQSEGENIKVAGTVSNQDIVKYVSVGSTYTLNKNMTTYVDYKINLLDENEFTKSTGTATDNIVAVGLVYQF